MTTPQQDSSLSTRNDIQEWLDENMTNGDGQSLSFDADAFYAWLLEHGYNTLKVRVTCIRGEDTNKTNRFYFILFYFLYALYTQKVADNRYDILTYYEGNIPLKIRQAMKIEYI